jgi:hypothetical protein
MQRRELIGALGATALAIHAPVVLAGPSDPLAGDPRRLYQRIARGRIGRLADGARDPQRVAEVVHRELPQLVEQNLAAMDPVAMALWVDEAEDALWPTLAGCYQAAIADAGRPHLLADLLALNLDVERLARLAPHFGSDALASALSKWRPEQMAGFLALRPPVAALPERGLPQSDPFLDYTIREIYLSLRTAPIGALSVRAALYETVSIVGKRFGVAYSVGFTLGSALAPVIEQHAPGLWHGIGATVNWAVTRLQPSSTAMQRGQVQHTLLQPFNVGPGAYFGLTTTGGDYFSVEELPVFITGGGTICWDCSPHRGAGR